MSQIYMYFAKLCCLTTRKESEYGPLVIHSPDWYKPIDATFLRAEPVTSNTSNAPIAPIPIKPFAPLKIFAPISVRLEQFCELLLTAIKQKDVMFLNMLEQEGRVLIFENPEDWDSALEVNKRNAYKNNVLGLVVASGKFTLSDGSILSELKITVTTNGELLFYFNGSRVAVSSFQIAIMVWEKKYKPKY